MTAARWERFGGWARAGIIIPDTAREKPMEGRVMAVGNGRTLDNGTKVAVECWRSWSEAGSRRNDAALGSREAASG